LLGIDDGKNFAMKIIAVIELDKWISQFDIDQNRKSAVTALACVVELYKQCHTVDDWLFSLTYAPCYSSLANDFSELGIELQPKGTADPLSSFYELVTFSQLHGKRPSHELAVIRLLANTFDPPCALIDAMVNNHIQQGHHYSRNQPAQIDADINIEIMNFSVLHEAWQEALLPDDRLQITPYIYRQQQRLNLGLFPDANNAILHA
jgi:spore coat polysaccharide biosynthesis protein SpsF (cytidylyltransferase family)